MQHPAVGGYQVPSGSIPDCYTDFDEAHETSLLMMQCRCLQQYVLSPDSGAGSSDFAAFVLRRSCLSNLSETLLPSSVVVCISGNGRGLSKFAGPRAFVVLFVPSDGPATFPE